MKKMLSAILLTASISALAQTVPTPVPVPVPAGNQCAVAYNSLERNYTSTLALQDGESIPDLNKVPLTNSHGDWDNKITRVVVKQGCTFIGYQYQDYNIDYNYGYSLGGFRKILENNTQRDNKIFVLHEGNDSISSVKCFCL